MHETTARELTGWQAGIELGFEARAGRTVLAHRARFGPLSVQRPFYPEGELCHVYLLHPPGGVAGGDSLRVRAEAAAGSAAMITTPGAGKFYRSAGPQAEQTVNLRVAAGASLEWLPQENILFPGADLRLQTHIDLAPGARFIGWEIHCLGLPANGERFIPGHARIGCRIERAGEPLLIESLQIEDELDLQGLAGLRGHPVVGSFYATCDDEHVAACCRAHLQAGESEAGLTLLDGLLVVRILAPSTSVARDCFIALWRQVRPALLARQAVQPRIWLT
jgi:urease accessory protein